MYFQGGKQRIKQSWSENEILIQTDTSTLSIALCTRTQKTAGLIYT